MKTFWTAIVAALAAFSAIFLAQKATKARRKAASEFSKAEIQRNIAGNTEAADEANIRAQKHEDVANEAATKLRARIKAIKGSEPISAREFEKQWTD